jgi:hypothetical protein
MEGAMGVTMPASKIALFTVSALAFGPDLLDQIRTLNVAPAHS